MPYAPKTPCRQPGCAALLDNPGYCSKHRVERHRAYNSAADRQSDQKFYKGRVWMATRKAHLQAEPLCRMCKAAGRLTAATHVDHIIERKAGGSDYDHSNLQSLCLSCHNSKTFRKEAASFGIG